MIIDRDIKYAVAVANTDDRTFAACPDLASRVNKIFNEVSTLWHFILNILTFGWYHENRKEMIKECLSGRCSQNYDSEISMDLQLPNFVRRERVVTQAEIAQLYADFGC